MSNETHFDIVLDFILDLANHIHSLTIYLQLTIYLTRLLLYSKHVRQCSCVPLYLLFYIRIIVIWITMQLQALIITRRMQGIVGASGKFILFLSSMVLFFIIIKNVHAHIRTIAIRI